ncbi:hypothetical protein OGATHE_000857 [Ogataea polymorpha]|uniref:Uncharacterized protein n=1 Tax=Ogataea polymorpha TaxID=460523 RepID=A0A9P8PS33_9ASCO|nr:hypothetical protein OGATHE_000857 [Ogataea polymorpha]
MMKVGSWYTRAHHPPVDSLTSYGLFDLQRHLVPQISWVIEVGLVVHKMVRQSGHAEIEQPTKNGHDDKQGNRLPDDVGSSQQRQVRIRALVKEVVLVVDAVDLLVEAEDLWQVCGLGVGNSGLSAVVDKFSQVVNSLGFLRHVACQRAWQQSGEHLVEHEGVANL